MQEDIVDLKGSQAKMQEDIVDLKSSQAKMQEDIVDLKSSQEKMQGDILRIEDTMHDKFGALFDARQAQLECNFRVENALTRIENKLDKAELRAIGAFDLASRRVR